MSVARLMAVLQELAKRGRWCLSEPTLRTFIPESANTFRVAMARHVRAGVVSRLAPGLYLNPFVPVPPWALERLATHLRPNDCFYVSLESALHEHGFLSQVPNRLTVMTSGRRHTMTTPLGTIEWVHTSRSPAAWRPRTSFMPVRGIHLASAELAREDLSHVGRNLDLLEEATGHALHV